MPPKPAASAATAAAAKAVAPPPEPEPEKPPVETIKFTIMFESTAATLTKDTTTVHNGRFLYKFPGSPSEERSVTDETVIWYPKDAEEVVETPMKGSKEEKEMEEREAAKAAELAAQGAAAAASKGGKPPGAGDSKATTANLDAVTKENTQVINALPSFITTRWKQVIEVPLPLEKNLIYAVEDDALNLVYECKTYNADAPAEDAGSTDEKKGGSKDVKAPVKADPKKPAPVVKDKSKPLGTDEVSARPVSEFFPKDIMDALTWTIDTSIVLNLSPLLLNHDVPVVWESSADPDDGMLPPPRGFTKLRIHVYANRSLLSADERRQYLPCEFNLETVRNLPAYPLSHNRLSELYRPVTLNATFFEGCFTDKNAQSLTLATHPRLHKNKLVYNERKCFLLGRANLAKLAWSAQNTFLEVNVHDRDLLQYGRVQNDWSFIDDILQEEKGKNKFRTKKESEDATAKEVAVSEGAATDAKKAPLPAVGKAAAAAPSAPAAAGKAGAGTVAAGKAAPSVVPDLKKEAEEGDSEETIKEDTAAADAARKAREQAEAVRRRADEFSIYGKAKFHLGDLCRGSLKFTLHADVSCVLPKKDDQLLGTDPSLANRKDPYVQANTEVVLSVKMAHLLPLNLVSHSLKCRFNRIVYVLRYNDTTSYRAIVNTIADCNARALDMLDAPRRQLVNVQLQPEQSSDESHLDVITGFQVIDPQYRMLVVEGLADHAISSDVEPGTNAMALLRDALEKSAVNNNRMQYQDNPSVTFSTRLYTAFDITIKNIRLTCSLKTIANTCEIYLSSSSEQGIMRCFTCLYSLRSTNCLRLSKILDSFPSVKDLLQFEKKYGTFVSDLDVDGVPEAKHAQPSSSKKSLPSAGTKSPSSPRAGKAAQAPGKQPSVSAMDQFKSPIRAEEDLRGRASSSLGFNEGSAPGDRGGANTNTNATSEAAVIAAKDATLARLRKLGRETVIVPKVDSHNPAFDLWLKEQKVADVVCRNLDMIHRQSNEAAERWAVLMKSLPPRVLSEHEYHAMMKDQVDADPNLKKNYELESGWKVISPLSAPLRLHPTRVAELKEPWQAPSWMFDEATAQQVMLKEEREKDKKKWREGQTIKNKYELRKNFRVPILPSSVFEKQIPRVDDGQGVSAVGALQEKLEAKRKEHEEWVKKVIVDNANFFVVRSTLGAIAESNDRKPPPAHQLDRFRPLLEDPPVKKGYTFKVRSRTTGKVKDLTLREDLFTFASAAEKVADQKAAKANDLRGQQFHYMPSLHPSPFHLSSMNKSEVYKPIRYDIDD